jgi:ketosteroid isomerase-like protein
VDRGYSSCGLGTRQLAVLSLCRTKLVGSQQQVNLVVPHLGVEMRRISKSLLVIPVMLFCAAVVLGQTFTKPATGHKTEDFAAIMKKIRDTWVQEFNAGHADKVAALYADDAVLMRRNGSVHSRDSILAELQRSISAEARNYTIQSLRAESSGDIGYDTGIYNENFPHHLAEGNYLMVVKRINGVWKIVAHAAVPNPRQK